MRKGREMRRCIFSVGGVKGDKRNGSSCSSVSIEKVPWRRAELLPMSGRQVR